MDVTKIHNT